MLRVSCLGIWWRHDIWISKTLKVDYLKNEKVFFLISQVLSFRHTKQTSKNVAGTTFNNIHQWNSFLITYLSFLISQNFTKRSYLFCFLEDQILFCYFWFMIFSPTFQLFKKSMIFLLFFFNRISQGFCYFTFWAFTI